MRALGSGGTAGDADEVELQTRWELYNVTIEPERLGVGYEAIEMLWETKIFAAAQAAGDNLIDRVMARMDSGSGDYPSMMDIAEMVEEVSNKGYGTEDRCPFQLGKIEFSNYVVRIWLARFIKDLLKED